MAAAKGKTGAKASTRERAGDGLPKAAVKPPKSLYPKQKSTPKMGRKEAAVAYVRASTEEQEITLLVQADKIKAYCEMRGIALAQVVKDAGVSGSVPLAQRPAGKKLGAMLAKF